MFKFIIRIIITAMFLSPQLTSTPHEHRNFGPDFVHLVLLIYTDTSSEISVETKTLNQKDATNTKLRTAITSMLDEHIGNNKLILPDEIMADVLTSYQVHGIGSADVVSGENIIPFSIGGKNFGTVAIIPEQPRKYFCFTEEKKISVGVVVFEYHLKWNQLSKMVRQQIEVVRGKLDEFKTCPHCNHGHTFILLNTK
ncbi:hypothetical protein HOD08_04385 [bacterium]|nr:hypothetical protein [bacterium]